MSGPIVSVPAATMDALRGIENLEDRMRQLDGLS